MRVMLLILPAQIFVPLSNGKVMGAMSLVVLALAFVLPVVQATTIVSFPSI